jgi:hypothetical protein
MSVTSQQGLWVQVVSLLGSHDVGKLVDQQVAVILLCTGV